MIKDVYYPEGFKTDEFIDFTPFSKNVEPFHAGQGYENQPARPIECLICKATTFEVALGDHWTGVRCTNCKYEICLHSG